MTRPRNTEHTTGPAGRSWLAVAALALAACTSRPQITLSVDTSAGIPCEIDHIRIQATGTGSSTATFERDLAGVHLPLVLKLSDETADGMFKLEVIGLKGTTEVLRSSGQLAFSRSGDSAARVVLGSKCTPDAPCSPDTMGSTPALAARASCGPEVRRYSNARSALPFEDVCNAAEGAHGIVLTSGRSGAELLPLPETALLGFRFYGKPIHQVWAHTDGYIAFTPTEPDPSDVHLPGPFDSGLNGHGVSPPPRSIMAFWSTLTPSTTGVCYRLRGDPGTQRLTVSWHKTCLTETCVTDDLNFGITLDESDQRIRLTYGTMHAENVAYAQGIQSTVGIVNSANPDAAGCPVSECDPGGLCKDGVTPCGYSQLFSNMAQNPLGDYEFDPIAEPK